MALAFSMQAEISTTKKNVKSNLTSATTEKHHSTGEAKGMQCDWTLRSEDAGCKNNDWTSAP